MSQLYQTPSDDDQHLQSTLQPSEKDIPPIDQDETSHSSPAENLPSTSPRSRRFHQTLDDLIGDLNALRKSRPTLNNTQNVRPFTVTITAIATAVNGLLYLLLVPFWFLLLFYIDSLKFDVYSFYSFLGVNVQTTPITDLSIIQDLAIGAILYCSLLGIAHLYLARGLWQYRYRAYWGTMGLQALAILIQFIILTLFHSGSFFLACVYLPLLIVSLATYGFHGRQSYLRGQQRYQLSALFRRRRTLLVVGVVIILGAILATTVFVATGRKSTTPTPTPTPIPTPTNTPQSVINDFCQNLLSQNYPAAYADYSTHLQGQTSLTDFENSWYGQQISNCNPPTIPTTTGSSITASWSPYEYYSGQVYYSVTFVLQGNEWKIDQITSA